jgi:quinoprotein glucose dehydrogenase
MAVGRTTRTFLDSTQVIKANFGQLDVAWTYASNDIISGVWNPLIAGNVMYVLARNNSLAALDATSGKEIWIHECSAGNCSTRH